MGMDLRQHPHTSKGAPRIQVDPSEGSRIDMISPNWCDKTTWYQEATQVTGETLTDSGDGLTFNSAHTYWVDVTHGKLTGENELESTHKPVVKVDSVEKTESSPGTTDADYQINYATGDVTFNASQSGKTVTATYRYAGSSLFTIAPTAGKILRLTEIEVQLSENFELLDSVFFQLHVGGSPYGSPQVYKTMLDFINDASLLYPSIPAIGGASWRGTLSPIRILRWPYADRAVTDLKSSLGMAVTVALENDTEFGGDVAVATFYGISENE